MEYESKFLDKRELKRLNKLNSNLNVLLIWPRFPPTFWNNYFSFRDIVRGIKSAIIPLSPLVVASFFPESWNAKFIDENNEKITEEDFEWADVMIVSATMDQIDSLRDIILMAHSKNKPVVIGGIDPSMRSHFYKKADYLHSGLIGDETIKLFEYLDKNPIRQKKQKIFKTKKILHLKDYPLPRYGLAKFGDYGMMSIHTRSGCPFGCEFCEIHEFYGLIPVSKKTKQVISELNDLYNKGWRGAVFISDDNFIGNIEKAKELTKEILKWQKKKNYPFYFLMSASINLAKEKELLDLMKKAKFFNAMVGIESLDTSVLKSIGKNQNLQNPIFESIKELQKNGIQVIGAFILGFDDENPNYVRQVGDFVEKTAICIPQINLLLALQETKMYYRLLKEKRLITSDKEIILDSNIIFKPYPEKIYSDYVELWKRIFEPKTFFNRVKRNFQINRGGNVDYNRLIPNVSKLSTLFNIVYYMGLKSDYKKEFWKFFLWSVYNNAGGFFTYYSFQAYHLIAFREELLKNTPVFMRCKKPVKNKDYARVKNGPVLYSSQNNI